LFRTDPLVKFQKSIDNGLWSAITGISELNLHKTTWGPTMVEGIVHKVG